MKDNTRKQDFLDAALELFYEKGYDKASVNDIIARLDASKGGFYHYFKSKEDVLEAVALQYVEVEVIFTREISGRNDLNAIEKMNEIIRGILIQRLSNLFEREKISRIFAHEGNIRLLRKIAENKMRMIFVPYLSIIKQGIQEGVYDTPYPEETAEQIIQMLISLNSMIAKLAAAIEEKPDNTQTILHKLKAYQVLIERLLGTKHGTIEFDETVGNFIRSY